MRSVTELLGRLDPEGTGRIMFTKQGRGDGRHIPMVEVRKESKLQNKKMKKQ